MTKLSAERLIEIIESAGFTARDYSGRGMYGVSCVAVSDDECDLASLVEQCEDVTEAANMLRRMSTDSMGRGQVFYWSNIRWPEGD